MNYSTMSYIPVQKNHWVSFLFKFTGMVGGAALVAALATGFVHKVGAPARNAPVAAQVQYYANGIGKLGERSHWLTQASEGTRQWQKAKTYCQSQSQSQIESAGQGQGSTGQGGCGTINQLAESGY
ncbi:MAG: hypothetical protein ACYCXG_00250 [Acidiferrobacter sp.]